MNYEEFKSVIGECIQNPDKLTENIDNILEAVKTVYDTTEAQAQEIDALKNKNNDLRDTNVKLLMRQTFEQPEEKIEKTPDEIMNELIAKITS